MKNLKKIVAGSLVVATLTASIFSGGSDSTAKSQELIKPKVETFYMLTATDWKNDTWYSIPDKKVSLIFIDGSYLKTKKPNLKEMQKSYTIDTKISDSSLSVINNYVVNDLQKWSKAKKAKKIVKKADYIPTIKTTVSNVTKSKITVKIQIKQGKAFKYKKKNVYLSYKRSSGSMISKKIYYK